MKTHIYIFFLLTKLELFFKKWEYVVVGKASIVSVPKHIYVVVCESSALLAIAIISTDVYFYRLYVILVKLKMGIMNVLAVTIKLDDAVYLPIILCLNSFVPFAVCICF